MRREKRALLNLEIALNAHGMGPSSFAYLHMWFDWQSDAEDDSVSASALHYSCFVQQIVSPSFTSLLRLFNSVYYH